MIVRVFETGLVDGGLDGLADWLAVNAWAAGSTSPSAITGKPGSLGGALYTNIGGDRPQIYIVTKWADEASIAAHVGADWRTRGVSNPQESQYFTGPKSFSHYRRVNGTA